MQSLDSVLFDENGEGYIGYRNEPKQNNASDNIEDTVEYIDNSLHEISISTGVPGEPDDDHITTFCRNNGQLKITHALKSEWAEICPVSEKCSQLPIRELKKYLLTNLQTVILSLSQPRGEFGCIVRQYLNNIRTILDNTVEWHWCLDNLVALLGLTYDSGPNFVEAYDMACQLLAEIASRKDKGPPTDEQLTSDIFTILLAKNCTISVYSQIAFETILQILATCQNTNTVLQKLKWMRLQMGHYYQDKYIPLRCMRAEYLRVVLQSKHTTDATKEECITELQQSVTKEEVESVKIKLLQAVEPPPAPKTARPRNKKGTTTTKHK